MNVGNRPTVTSGSLSKRWTPMLIQDGFTPVSSFFLNHYATLEITPQEAMLVIHLMQFKWDSRNPFPKFSILAEKMGCSVDSVRGHARSLQKKGYLNKKRLSRSIEFDLSPLFTKLEERMKVNAR